MLFPINKQHMNYNHILDFMFWMQHYHFETINMPDMSSSHVAW
jgi:hypothetical protein